jgi:hypothetical protein
MLNLTPKNHKNSPVSMYNVNNFPGQISGPPFKGMGRETGEGKEWRGRGREGREKGEGWEGKGKEGRGGEGSIPQNLILRLQQWQRVLADGRLSKKLHH